ncbi:MAG TPA: competence/damage-inducible protein A [Clostridiales bacterium]|nr:competence/damage-inducible protein A [Clostridiales bacterium]
MIAEIVSVGTELLLGQIVNTNARFLARTLAGLGVDTYFQQVVGDNAVRLAEALRLALSRSDLVITTGGLGPTEDDLTKEVVAEVLGLRLVRDPEVARAITCRLEGHRSRPVPQAVAKQSLVPEGALVLPNPVGTAPGFIIPHGPKTLVLLPGPPAELEGVVNTHLLPHLERLAGGSRDGASSRSYLHTTVVKTCGLGEPEVEEAVRDLVSSPNPTVAPLVSVGEVHLRVTGKAADPDEARRITAGMVEKIQERLAANIFGYDDDTIAAACGAVLTRHGLTLSVAESLTGGLVGHLITEVPGSSAYFERGLVVYSNRAKVELLGVDPGLIRRRGAVSREVALAMARGVRDRAGTDIGVALTGIAGPGGATPGKPVGLVFIALCGEAAGGEVCHEYRFTGDRRLVKERSAHRVLALLWLGLRAWELRSSGPA